MNGRLYDPVLGRFLQADPIIQAPHNAQSHNRYAYVLNNPLSFSDPSGFSFWTKWRRPIIGLIAGIATGFAASYLTSSYLYAGLAGDVVPAATQASIATISNGVGAAAGGFASGGIMGGNIQSAVRGAFTGLLTFGAIQGLSDMMAGSGAGTASAGTAIGASTAGGDSVAQAINSTPNLPAAMQVPTSDAAVPDPNLSNHRLERIEIKGSSTQVVRIGQYSGFAWWWNHVIANPAAVTGPAAAAALTARTAMAATRGLSRYGGSFSTTTNAAGGRVVTSSGNIAQNDFASTVQSGVMQGQRVNILSGVHGEVSGAMRADISLFNADVLRFGQLPGVQVFDMVELIANPMQLRAILSGSGTTIGGLCNSGVCLRPFM